MHEILKAFIVFVLLFAATQATEIFCYHDVDRVCNKVGSGAQAHIANCRAKYVAFDTILPDLQAYVNTHISLSFEYLLLATYYSNYHKNREGFEKLFRDLSDDKWKNAIKLMKYIGKRGGKMNFKVRKPTTSTAKEPDYKLYEVASVAKALDFEKALAKETLSIHDKATGGLTEYYDPETSSYLEEHFIHKYSSNIRKLSGHVHDLLGIMDGPESSLGLHLFDEYLQKQ